MEDTALNQSVIIITGMHRSGTSLTASLLQSAGLNIGDRLMASNAGNSKGYFEDLDFVEFHENVLQSQGIDNQGWSKENRIEVQQQYLATAQNLILARKDQAIWGWKDPRTTLFLDFWCQLIPQAKYIFLYRSPWEVVDSLFRRGDIIFRTNPNFAVEQWCSYNQAILDFYQLYQERCILLEIGNVIRNPQDIIALIKQKFDLELRSPESLYDPSLYKVDGNIHYRQALITKFFPQALDIYSKLHQQADQKSISTIEQQSIEVNYESWILQDWNDLKRLSKEKQQVETQLAETEQQLQLEITEAKQIKAQETANQLAQTQQQLQTTQEELDKTQQQLRQIKEKLNQSQKQLQINQKQTEQFKLLVVAMESSKFWKLRKWWLNLRHQFNQPGMDTIYQNYLLSVGEVPPTDNPAPVDHAREHILSDNPKYQSWLAKSYPKPNELKKIADAIAKVSYKPLISIIVPVYNPPENFLREAIESVLEQAYGNWELCMADDCSTEPYVKSVLEEYAQKDSRIKVTFRTENGHICHTSNSALELATGEYIALLDHDDLLAPHALSEVVELLNEHPEADFIYSDEDKVDEHNIHCHPFFKPDWCP